MPGVEDPQLLHHTVIERANQRQPGHRTVSQCDAIHQRSQVNVAFIYIVHIEPDAGWYYFTPRNSSPDSCATNTDPPTDLGSQKRTAFLKAAAERFGRGPWVSEGVDMNGTTGTVNRCGQKGTQL